MEQSKSRIFSTSDEFSQGSVLSTCPITSYLNDLSKSLNELRMGCFIDFTCVNHLFYADDICLLAPSAFGLQKLLDVCTNFGTSHDIMFHPIKSKCVVFKPTRCNLVIPHVTLDNRQLESASEIKYLGIVLSSDMKDDIDVKRQLRSLYISANTILRKFARCTVPVKCKLIESYAMNFYCSYLWCNSNAQVLSRLRVAYNNIYRKILGYGYRDSAGTMFASNGIDNFEAKMREVCYGFKQRVAKSNNVIICAISDNFWMSNSYVHAYWNSKLYTCHYA